MAPASPLVLTRVPELRRPVALLAGLSVLTGVAAVGQALALAWLIAAVATGGRWQAPAIAVVVVVAARGLLSLATEVASTWAGQRTSATLRAGLLRSWLSGTDEAPPPERAVTLAGEGADAVDAYVGRFLPAVVAAVVVPGLSLVVLTLVDLWSALIVLLTVPLLPFFAALIGKHTQAQTQRRWDALTSLAGHFLDVVRGLPTLVIYDRAGHQERVIAQVGERYRTATVRTLRTAFLSTAALELLATISVALVAVAVGLRLAEGWVGLQVGLTAILLAPEAYWPIRKVGTEYHNAVDGQQALADLLPTERVKVPERSPLNAPNGQESRVRTRERANSGATGRIAASVSGSYTYPGSASGVGHATPEAAGIDITVSAGPGLTALTGSSGAGKSTVLDLLAGLRRSPDALVQAPVTVHYATQRPLLVPGSVRDNLLLAAPGASDTRAHQALVDVGLWDALADRQGLDTRLGDDGFGLSAGQRARLSLARAMLSDAALVLLDEPTAHVAAASRPHLHGLIRRLADDRPVVVATHDSDLAAAADHHHRLPTPSEANRPLTAEPRALAPTATTDVADPAESPPAPPPERHGVDRRRMALACLLGALSTSCGVALTATSGWLIVRAWQQPVILTLLVAIVGVRAFGIGRPVFRYAERLISHDLVLADLSQRRRELFTRLIPLTPARLGRRRRADLLTAVVSDLDDVVNARARVTVPLVSAVVASLVAAALIALVAPVAGLVLLGAGALVVAVGWVAQRAEQPNHAAEVSARAKVRRVSTSVAAQLPAYRALVGGYGDPDMSLARLHAAQRAGTVMALRSATVRGSATALTWAFVGVTALVLAMIAATGYTAGSLSAPVAALVALTPWALADLWAQIPEIFSHRARARAAQHRLDRVLDQEPAVVAPAPGMTAALPSGGTVSLRGVAAHWAPGPAETAWDLAPIDLDTGPGNALLLTGPNGVGKSTALAVLARHLDPAVGEYHLGGTDVGDLPLASARAPIAMVDDEPHVFAGTVRANLALARPGCSDAEIESALRAAGLRQWRAGLPDGLDTPLLGLSGGERTRLSLARALLSRRPVLLLDEPTAHLDPPTAATVMADVRAAASDRCLVVVSHDLTDNDGWMCLELTDQGTRVPESVP